MGRFSIYSAHTDTAFMHHGQWCFSTERVIVLKAVADKFVEILKQMAPDFASGSGVSERMVTTALDKLKDAQVKGAKFLVGGPEKLDQSTIKPTIVTGITPDMLMADEETFGRKFPSEHLPGDMMLPILQSSCRKF